LGWARLRDRHEIEALMRLSEFFDKTSEWFANYRWRSLLCKHAELVDGHPDELRATCNQRTAGLYLSMETSLALGLLLRVASESDCFEANGVAHDSENRMWGPT